MRNIYQEIVNLAVIVAKKSYIEIPELKTVI